jgi:hypothetical protein
MQQAFGTVLWIVCAAAAVAALAMLVRSGKTWDDYGKRGLLLDRDLPRDPTPGSAAAAAERDDEIRAMLRARNARRVRRGEEPLDIEQELRRLTTADPQIDSALRAEIRDLVLARNHRRVRAGKPPLDVEAEIEREIRDFGDL